jgi:ligand-binding SRPBCC domain-containing protein
MRLAADTWVDVPRERVFPFFADAANLQVLTPPWLRFQIDTPTPIDMYPGRQISYGIRVHGVPMRWTSEISRYEPPAMFVDEQRRGPYRTWIHTHRFVEERGGTRLLDDVEFEMFAGWLVGPLVARDLRAIFTYRHETLLKIFGQPQPWPPPAVTIHRHP